LQNYLVMPLSQFLNTKIKEAVVRARCARARAREAASSLTR